MGLTKPDTTPSLPADLPASALAPHDASDLGRDAIPMDHHDRYLLPLPGTTLEDGRVPWTRGSTVKGRSQNKEMLNAYDRRMIIKGMALAPDLQALAAATPLGARGAFQIFKEIEEQARTIAGGRAASNFGSAMHSFTQAYDEGDPLDDVLERMPEALRPDLLAYVAELKRWGLRPVPELIERVVVNENLRTGVKHDGSTSTRKDAAAGAGARFDRMYLWTDPADGRDYLVPGDLKTGKNAVAYGSAETCVQEAIAARGTAMWNEETNTWDDMPPSIGGPVGDPEGLPEGYEAKGPFLRRDFGVLIHLPIGTGTCHVEELDLEYGWRVAKLAVDLMIADKAKDHCHKPFSARMDVGKPDPFATIAAQDAAPGMELEAEQAFTTPSVSGTEPGEPVEPEVDTFPAVATKAKDGSELQPLAAKGERGCSVCRRRGHRAGSAKCWGDAVTTQSRFAPVAVAATVPVPAGVIACGPDGAVTELTPGDAEQVKAFADQLQQAADTERQMADLANADRIAGRDHGVQKRLEESCSHSGGFTRRTTSLDDGSTTDVWVCAACKQESPQAEQARRAREAMNAGQPHEPTEQEMAEKVRQATLATDAPEEAKADALAALEADNEPAPEDDPSEPAGDQDAEPADGRDLTYLERIRKAETREELSAIRREAIAAGIGREALAEITSAGLDVLRRL